MCKAMAIIIYRTGRVQRYEVLNSQIQADCLCRQYGGWRRAKL